MNPIVLELAGSIQQELCKTYAAYKQPSKDPYVTSFFKLDGASVSIYTSGKIVFQGKKAPLYAEKWGWEQGSTTTTTTTTSSITPSEQNFPIIGSDEVGNGSYFGGLAVVASFVTPNDHAFLRSLGVKDSKKLTDKKICQIAPLLKERILYQELLLPPKKYNQAIQDGYNAVSVKVALHNQAIFLLLQKGVQAEKIVIDAFTSHKNYNRHLIKEKNHFPNPISLEEKAESKYLAVAVSSIIARNMFLENLAQLEQEIGLTLPSGAGEDVDQIASQILKMHGLAGLEMTAKLHFVNTKKAQILLE